MEITDVNTLFGAYPSRHPDSTADALMAAMGANGVDYCLTLSTVGMFYDDAAGNTETLAACRRLHNLIPAATIDPRGYWGQPDIFATLAKSYEMYRFFPREQGWPVEYAPFREILNAIAAGAPKPIMIGVRKPGDISKIAGILDGSAQTVILEGVSPETLSEAIAVMRRNSAVYIETHALRSPGALTLLRDTIGIGQVLFGSSAPGLSLGAALRYVHGSGLSNADQEMVLGGNAAKIWHGGEA